MIARMVLPQFGGSPSVWTTCMLFFQVLLLAGYLYAHLSWTWLPRKAQVVIHLLMLLVPLAFLPFAITPDRALPGGQEPTVSLLTLLLVTVGMPFFVVATSSPLLQAWYSAARGGDSGDPYWLYAASNTGSLASLVGYPFLIQPNFTLRAQSAIWAVGYLVLL